jgi:hypothetical protein
VPSKNVVWDDVPVDRVAHWFTGSWFLLKETRTPVYVTSYYDNKLCVCDTSGINSLVSISDLVVATPEVGYVEYRKNQRADASYLSYNGAQCYKKGLVRTNIDAKKLTWDRGGRGYVRVPDGIFKEILRGDASSVSAVFNAPKRSLGEMLTILCISGDDTGVISRNFCLRKHPLRRASLEFYYSICYRECPVGHITEQESRARDRAPVIYLDKNFSFLKQKIEQEFGDVQIIDA